MNKTILLGRLSKDSELRYSANGLAILRNSIAVNDGYGDNKKVDFFNIVCFGKTAEAVAQFTEKGSRVVISGKVKNNNYQKDGKTVYSTEIHVEDIEFLSQKKEASTSKTINDFEDDFGF